MLRSEKSKLEIKEGWSMIRVFCILNQPGCRYHAALDEHLLVGDQELICSNHFHETGPNYLGVSTCLSENKGRLVDYRILSNRSTSLFETPL